MFRNLLRGLALPPVLSALLLPATAGATNIDELVVTASPHNKRLAEIPGALDILGREQLQRHAAATLGDTLQNTPGINSSSFGPGVGLPVIRGLSGKRVELLHNGMAVADASDVSPDHAVATEPLLADRIEILRGPATLRYGPGAIGGVVNVIENSIHADPLDGVHGALETRHDGNNDGDALVGRFDTGNGTWALHLSGVHRDSNEVEIPGATARTVDDPEDTTFGHLANTDARSTSWTLGLSRVTDHLVIGASVNRLDNEYGIPPGGHQHGEEEHDEEHVEQAEEEHGHEEEEQEEDHGSLFTRIDLAQTSWQGRILLRDLEGMVERVSLDLNRTDYRHLELEIEDGAREIGTVFDVDSTELRLEATHAPLGDWTGTLGLQAGRRDFGARGPEAFVPPSETDNLGLFLIEDRDLGEGSLELGARVDRQRISSPGRGDIDHHSFNASASLLYPVGETQRLGLILSRSERPPAVEELLSDGEHVATRSLEIGDPGLDTESALNLEFTWRYDGPFQAQASLYHRRFDDFIYARNTGARFSHELEEEGFAGLSACSASAGDFHDEETFEEALPCLAYRQEDARFTGLEAELTLPLTEAQSLRLWGDSVRARLDEGGEVPRTPPARLGGAWEFERGRWSASLDLLHAFEQNDPGRNEAPTDSYTRLEAFLRYGTEQWSVFVEGNNLTDEEIRNAASFLRDIAPEPGRGIVLGASINF